MKKLIAIGGLLVFALVGFLAAAPADAQQVDCPTVYAARTDGDAVAINTGLQPQERLAVVIIDKCTASPYKQMQVLEVLKYIRAMGSTISVYNGELGAVVGIPLSSIRQFVSPCQSCN